MAAITRTSTLIVRGLPSRSNSPVSSTRSSLACTSSDSSPTSSRKSVEPSATSKRPTWRVRAPVKAPFSRPNSSLSTSPDGSAAQLTLTIRWSRRGLSRWMAWATSSLPVPVSPRMSTEESVGATCSTRRRTFWMAGLCPVTSPCGSTTLISAFR